MKNYLSPIDFGFSKKDPSIILTYKKAKIQKMI